MSTRTRGLVGYVMDDQEVTGGYDRYLLLRRPDGAMLMVHTEGVGFEVTEEKPWRWNDYRDDVHVFPPHALVAMCVGAEQVDLADWIRVFGARLESNFAQVLGWAREGGWAPALADPWVNSPFT